MKTRNEILKGKRLTAGICAVLLIAGSSVGLMTTFSAKNSYTQEDKSQTEVTSPKKDDTISAGGTVSSSQLEATLGIKNSSAKLTVEEVLVSSGESVSEGTELYKLTDESIEKAKKTLQSELSSASNTLLDKKTSYNVEQNKAKALLESETLLGETAEQEFNDSVSSLDSALQEAYDEYTKASSTVANTPSQISQYQAQINSLQAEIDDLQYEKDNIQNEYNSAKSAYDSASKSYDNARSDYKSAEGVVGYFEKALGINDENSKLSPMEEYVKTDIPADSHGSGENMPDGEMPSGDMPEGGFSGGRFSGGMIMSSRSYDSQAPATEETEKQKQEPEKQEVAIDPEEYASAKVTEALKELYDQACEEYEQKRSDCEKAEGTLKETESTYSDISRQLSEYSSAIEERQSSIKTIEKEISLLESSLSQAKSNITKLRSEYNSLSLSYESDKLELQNSYDTNSASGENAEYHYEITCSTLEDELEEAQTAYDTAKENLSIFETELADGYINADRDGIIYSAEWQEGRSAGLTSAYVYYIDETSYVTTVELDQNDVTKITIGDSVMIYSSETGIANGKITAISEGTVNSLADVRFNVTVSADEGASLYSGESVNVYFNSGNISMNELSDFKDSSEGESGEDRGSRGFPGFGGDMPEGFDPSNIPDFINRKEN
ncbi:hypothetical protein [Ruminococcus albus]|uniref:HlyD family secretion protein n=1 Tax=Ruminococcus albus TaxID=1264 RepID=A0A1I1MUY1_RUMAL|nr:hypothetical protein [Ruminococcus albus]SFC89169.1 hypothetical protein SAMN02910406_02598 [Ruminococcus albus]